MSDQQSTSKFASLTGMGITNFIVLILGVLAVVSAIIFVFSQTDHPSALATVVPTWFDPVFFQYNFLLALFAIAIVPIITFFYVKRMSTDKVVHLRRQFSNQSWEKERAYILEQLTQTFRVRSYLPSVVFLVIVVMFGIGILLLLKPMPIVVSDEVLRTGVDFRRGANFLMLGPLMHEYVNNEIAYLRWLIVSLTAFQFGFLGAFVYFLTHLVRSYFTFDLTPNLFVSSSVRMLMGSIISLVISFAIVTIDDSGAATIGTEKASISIGWLPAFSFMVGHFPHRALMWMSKQMSTKFGMGKSAYKDIPLEKLTGMSHSHEIRLRREGFDNVENVARSDCLELAVATGFSYRQLRAWVGEAWILTHMREDSELFQQATGIVTSDDLIVFLRGQDNSDMPNGSLQWDQILTVPEDVKPRLVRKAEILCLLLPGLPEGLKDLASE